MTLPSRSSIARSRHGSEHGGPDAQGAAPHDFSTNGNACGPCAHAVEALRAVDAARYPDPAYTALRASLAEFHGVGPERIVVAASASEFIFRITAAVARCGGRSVLLPRYGYGDYAKAASGWGLELCREGQDGRERSAGEASLVWLCDPSSPLGQPVDGLGARIDALPAHATCVLDLAYEPLRLQGGLDLNRRQRDRVWQLWTPNKALGLTGIRAAYAIAPTVRHTEEGPPATQRKAVRASVDALASSWPVGAHGVALLESWTQAATQQWLAETRGVLGAWKSAQIALCIDLGWDVAPSVANFFCARPVDISVDVGETAVRLRSAGIKVRPTGSFGLPGNLRLSVLTPTSQQALELTLR